MPVDVEQQLAALGKLWDETIAHVETPEIVTHDTARRNGSIIGVDGQAVAPAPDRARGIYQFTEEEVTMIELETPSQTDEPRKRSKRVLVAGLLAAAAVVAIALVAVRRDDPVSPADQPAPTVTAPPTLPPQALFGAAGTQLAPGTYFLDEVEGEPTPRILVTIGDGWGTYGDWGLTKDEGRTITFTFLDRVFLDACHPGDGNHPGPLNSLAGLATALSEQGGWIDVTTPSDISIDGYAGKAFQRTVPADLAACLETRLNSGEQSVYSPGETVTSWVLDLNGTFIVVEARVNAAAPPEAGAELAAVLESIRIAPG